MTQRLVEQYHPGDRVEIHFERGDDTGWQRGEVVAAQHPGLWVRTADGRLWFVTNTRRIRSAGAPPPDPHGRSST